MMLTRIGPSGLTTNRLDSTYYRPAHLRDAQLRGAWTRSTLDELRSPSAPIVYGVLKPDDRGEKFRVAKAESFEGMFVSAEDCDPVSEEMFHEFGRAEAIDGDLLVAIGGYVGRPALLRVEDGLRVVVNRHLARVRIDKVRVDSGWVLAYFSSPRGERQLTREITGSVQAGINLCDLRLVDVPLPSAEAQCYIGDKVRQAERMRDRARRLEAAVATTHAPYIVPPTGIDFAKRTRRLAARSLTERLDAHFYPSAVEQYFRQLGGPTRSLDRLCALVVNGQSQPEAEEGVPQATVTNLGRSFVEAPLRTVVRPADGSRALAPHDLLLCNAAHNKSYIGRDVTYSQVEGPYPSTEVMVVRVDRAQVPASFVRHYLKTEIGYLQIQSTIRGITAHSYPSDVRLLEIPMPVVPDGDREAWFATDDQMLAAGRCFDAAMVLTGVATTLVENLIDGRLTEADLVAAQKALEVGDRSADREILKGLRQSDAPDAKPLIADVDALYALLDGSEGQDA
ncbi:MAG: hypothetical protein IPN34_16715 [Planctomycetes bacterium]|nr:hypothetical protein [Planctomycetota bacterium]